jgi:hypothetical protein
MRLTPTLTALLACLLVGCFAEARAAEPSEAEKLYAQANRYTFAMYEKKLTEKQKEDWIKTEADLFRGMSAGGIPIDQAFFERIGLEAAANRMLPLLNTPAPAVSKDFDYKLMRGAYEAGSIFRARGHQLCQQGKITEGYGWFLRAHQLARKCGKDQGREQLMISTWIERDAYFSAAGYVEVWPEAERLAYAEKLNLLPPLLDAETASMNDWRIVAPPWLGFLRPIFQDGDMWWVSLKEGRLLRPIFGSNIWLENLRLNEERRATALKLALRYGASLQADQVALLTDGVGKPLKLGTSFEHKRKAIVGEPRARREPGVTRDESEYQPTDYLIIGPIN